MQYALKILISAILLVTVSELSKRSGWLGGLIASLPVVSILALSWLYLETQNPNRVIALSWGIFWMVIPSLSLFLFLPFLLKKQLDFWVALPLACLLTALVYYGMGQLYTRLGIKLD